MRPSPLFYPESYAAPDACTCGPQNYLDYLIPDALWGLSIKQACCIHDYMYTAGRTQADKETADRVFLENMLVLIDAAKSNRFLRWMRRRSAWSYYQAVHRFGGPIFWNQEKFNATLAQFAAPAADFQGSRTA